MGRWVLMFCISAGTAVAQSSSGQTPLLLALIEQVTPGNAGRSDNAVPPVALVQCRQPEYTEEARIAHLSGIVMMALTVDDNGMPSGIHVVSPVGLGLDENAVNCMRQSRYSPAQKDGKPVPQKISVALAFQERWDSDWHLSAATFRIADGCTRPRVVKAKFPGATGDRRSATVCVHLTVGRDGVPHNMQVASPQDPRLDKEALAIVSGLVFRPGIQNRDTVDVPATLTLVHGVDTRTMASSHQPR
jgi:TonB family protein